MAELKENTTISEVFREMSSNIEFAAEFLLNTRMKCPTYNFWRCFQGVVMPDLAKAIWEDKFWYAREKVKDEKQFEESIKA